MNISAVRTKGYENNRLRRRRENKPNSNPIQTQYKPNLPAPSDETNPIQTQYKPNQTQFQRQKMLLHMTINGRLIFA
jgi:hypothetical protein